MSDEKSIEDLVAIIKNKYPNFRIVTRVRERADADGASIKAEPFGLLVYADESDRYIIGYAHNLKNALAGTVSYINSQETMLPTGGTCTAISGSQDVLDLKELLIGTAIDVTHLFASLRALSKSLHPIALTGSYEDIENQPNLLALYMQVIEANQRSHNTRFWMWVSFGISVLALSTTSYLIYLLSR